MIHKIVSKHLLLLLISSLFVIGCNRKELNIEKLNNRTAEEIYSIGKKYQNNKKYEDAVLAFEEVGNQHPYSKYVAEAQLEAGKCYFKIKC